MTHGTDGGYQMHLRRGEEPCEPCKVARRAYAAAWRKRNAETYKKRAKRQAQARGRALSELQRMYPEDYAELRLKALKEIP